MNSAEQLLSEVRRKMALSDWYLRLKIEEADALRDAWIQSLNEKKAVEPKKYLCPICNEPSISTCRCFRQDATCKNSHQWHKCTKHLCIVEGPSDHSLDIMTCTCKKREGLNEYPGVDPIVQNFIKSIPKHDQVQYATRDQLYYLIDIAHKLGLYDAADQIKKMVNIK